MRAVGDLDQEREARPLEHDEKSREKVVNGPFPRAQYERLMVGLTEARRRKAKIEHRTRGYRDENGVWQGGLLSFVRYFWHILEPGTKFRMLATMSSNPNT